MKYLKGRTYDDFTAYADENPELSIVEMDIVYNNSTAGPFMQTFKFLSYSFMFIIYHEENSFFRWIANHRIFFFN